MSIELWGTFSVRDHLVHRAFIADVLLYDRLVIPTLPEDAPEDQWPPEWRLATQRTLLRDLDDLAIAIPWDKNRRDAWQKRFDDERPSERGLARAEMSGVIAKDVAAARADLPYRVTRGLLQDFVNKDADDKLFNKLRVTRKVRPGSKLEAVSAYPSFEAFTADRPEVELSAQTARPSVPTHVFGWQFFVPESAEQGLDEDRRLLQKAIKLARNQEFVDMRGEFYKWWTDVTDSGMAVEDAKKDMQNRVAEYTELMKGEGWKDAARYAVKVADAFSGGLGLVNELAAAGAEAFLGSADVFMDAATRRDNVSARLKVAAIFHDARTRLGWKESTTGS